MVKNSARAAEGSQVNRDLRASYLNLLRRLKAEVTATISELEDGGHAVRQNAVGMVFFKAETNQRIIEQFQSAIRELDEIYITHTKGDAD